MKKREKGTKHNYELSVPCRILLGGDSVACGLIIPGLRAMQMCLPCISPALHCSRFVCKALKASCSHATRSLLIKELLLHIEQDISSHACQTYWILSFFISVNKKQRQTQRASSERRAEVVCISLQVDMRTAV